MSINLEENALMITFSISVQKGKTQEWLNENLDWLKNISSYGVSLYLQEAERRGWIKSQAPKGMEDKECDLIYFATKKGINAYNNDPRFQ